MCISWTNKGFDIINMNGATMKIINFRGKKRGQRKDAELCMLMFMFVQCFVTLLYYDTIKIFVIHKAIYVHHGFVTRS